MRIGVGMRPIQLLVKLPIEFTTLVTMNRLNYSISLKFSKKALGQKAQKEFLSIQPGDVPVTYANVEALEKDVDFRPNTPIEEGIERFVAWYRDYYKIPVF